MMRARAPCRQLAATLHPVVEDQYIDANGALKGTFSYYWDDWSIRAYTLDLVYDQHVGSNWIVTPELRFYSQGAAPTPLGEGEGVSSPALVSSADVTTLTMTFGLSWRY